MPEPTINIYKHLIEPIGQRLQDDPRFSGVKVFYDTDEVAFTEMPAIEYYVDSPWEDEARGSGSYSLQTRKLTAKMAFSVWVFDGSSRARMDEALFQIGGLLMDFIHGGREWDSTNGVSVTNTPLIWDVVRPETETGFVGMHRIVAEFQIFSGTGR